MLDVSLLHAPRGMEQSAVLTLTLTWDTPAVIAPDRKPMQLQSEPAQFFSSKYCCIRWPSIEDKRELPAAGELG